MYNPKNILWFIGSLAIILCFVFTLSAYDKSWGFDWTGIRTEIRDSVRVIEKKPYLSYGLDPILGLRKYAKHEGLLDNATLAELYALINYPDNTVKFMAYKTLLINRNVKAYPLLKSALNDTTAFAGSRVGCYADILPLGAFLCEKLFYVHLDKTTASPPPPEIMAEIAAYLSAEEIEFLVDLYEERKEHYLKKYHAW